MISPSFSVTFYTVSVTKLWHHLSWWRAFASALAGATFDRSYWRRQSSIEASAKLIEPQAARTKVHFLVAIRHGTGHASIFGFDYDELCDELCSCGPRDKNTTTFHVTKFGAAEGRLEKTRTFLRHIRKITWLRWEAQCSSSSRKKVTSASAAGARLQWHLAVV